MSSPDRQTRSRADGTSADPEALIGELLARRGDGRTLLPYHRVMARWDADFFRAYNEWYSQVMLAERPGGLDTRTRELIVIAGCAAVRETEGLRLHVRKALEIGVPVEQLLDAVATAAILGGMPAMRDAMAIVAEEAGYLG